MISCTKTKSSTDRATDSVAVAQANSSETEIRDCLFDTTIQTEDFLKKVPEFKNYIWDDASKTALITLANKETIVVERGGCTHFKIIGQWMQRTPKKGIEDISYWLQQCKWLSEKIMPIAEVEKLHELLDSKRYKIEQGEKRTLITLLDKEYKEWYFSVATVMNEGQTQVFLEVICHVN